MPLQRHDTSPVPRPSGLIPPVADLGGVTELRLHGVGGTTPEDLLGDAAPQHVAGDRIAGFYRTADVAGRHVEAYSWGGLTSRSGSRVLWLLLFPFALANVAGWMCTPRTHAGRVRFWLHRATVRWAALGLTLNLLLIAALAGMELLGYQCGGQPACADDTWPLALLHAAPLTGHPGRRILAGALLPLALLALLAVLALRSISRYEATTPTPTPDATAPAGRTETATRRGVGLADPCFWDGQRSALDLGYLHLAAGLAFVAVALAHTVLESGQQVGVGAATLAGCLALALGGLVLLGALVFVAVEHRPAAVPLTLLGLGGAAVGLAGWFAAVQPAYAQPFGYLPGMQTVADVVLCGVFLALLLVLAVTITGGWVRGTFLAFGPFVALTLGVLALDVVLVSVMTRVAALTAEVSTRAHLPAVPNGQVELYVYPIVGKLVPYLTLVPLALVLLFVAYELVGYVRAGIDPVALARVRAWYRGQRPRPESEPGWQRDALDDDPPVRRTRGWAARLRLDHGWAARIARARRVARIPRDLDTLCTAIAATGAVLLAVLLVRYQLHGKQPWGTQWATTLGSYLAAGVPAVVILVLRRGWRDLHSRRRIAVLWDVLTFWPRAYHPLAPPSYAERAVPELQRRLWRLRDSGGRVVIAAHSQGTVLAAAALLQREHRPPDASVALVTFGSPLTTLYGWAFPAYFGESVLRRLAPTGDDAEAGLYAWRNFHYQTDYIGGPVFPSGHPARVDVELPDPATNWYVHGQPLPAPRRHSGYWVDPAVWRTVDDLAERLAAPADDAARVAPAPDDAGSSESP
ncbi:hypothetical protein [Micromonospora sp. HM5-17]|uniref:hypothetical protein n=1 Tax=Micromonospora sp. HM5-17 TaxID=2487710 RepID=UPI000F481B35|nr:hypothetical protein [Micromonospora sp. HM5-17]ROT31694.1 hypothetical protein EF879_14935 [Micromonospora sp. HM5-17]